MTARTDEPSAAVRIRVMKRDRFTCVYCGTTGAESELEIDHVHPVSKGGSHHISNLVTACRKCNQAKGAGTMKRMAAPSAVAPSSGGPIGLYIHTLKDGLIQFQGQIIGTDGDAFLVQLFSFMSGDPTEVKMFERAFIYGQECRLYADHAAWISAHEKECRRQMRQRDGAA